MPPGFAGLFIIKTEKRKPTYITVPYITVPCITVQKRTAGKRGRQRPEKKTVSGFPTAGSSK